MILSAMPLSQISRDLHLSESALGRHRRSHVGNLLSQVRLTEDTATSDLLSRLVDTLDDVAAVRAASLAKGSPTLLLRSIDSTVRVVSLLLDRLGFDGIQIAAELKDGNQVAAAAAKVVRQHPEFGGLLAAALQDDDAPDIADAVRTLATSAAIAQGKPDNDKVL
jgi:hypothetical protein